MGRLAIIVGVTSAVVILVVVVAVAVIRTEHIWRVEYPVVDTDCGKVEGRHNNQYNTDEFYGIPFAAPPVGELRWEDPQPLPRPHGDQCWQGVRKAREIRAECAQRDPSKDKHTGSEDCLYLNVITPSLNSSDLRPVMVWIHGGFLQWLNGAIEGYSPNSKLANELGYVFVSIQYRLAAFGFFVIDELPGSGNYGLKDQVAALQWVQNNIKHFGGDPQRVTIFGQSSGGTSVNALALSPSAKGLFQKAWSASGSSIMNKTLDDAKKQNAQDFLVSSSPLLDKCPNVTERCLKEVDTSTIASFVYPTWNFYNDSMDLPTKGYFEQALLVIDGKFLPDSPFNSYNGKTETYSDVPFILSTTAQEMDSGPVHHPTLPQWAKKEFEDYVAEKFDPFNLTEEVLSAYPWKKDAQYMYTSMTSDIRVSCLMDDYVTSARSALESPVYRIVVDGGPSSPVPLQSWEAKYAFHGWDTYTFFNHQKMFPGGPSPSDIAFRKNLMSVITDFVEGNDINVGCFGTNELTNQTLVLKDDVSVVDRFQKEQCEMWHRNGILNYAWIN